ncbi:MAG: LysM peptidoglycan-binding domain-containing protein [Chloroflexi bacterium]|nr:LysM peptidoglycan-binding domain-containing protein [Chloroflexota bacterium]
MRLRTFALGGALLVVGLLSACTGGDDEATPAATSVTEATPAPTATPMTRVPDPILVTGTGVPGGGATATEESVEYVVESGDTIGGIAERFGVDADVIREANDLEGDFINVGQTLIIPRGDAAPSSGDNPTAPTTPSDGSTYTVQAGDTAFGIALEFDTTVEALAAANGMTEDEITDLQIGQVINLPSPQ